jgi:hypothetical protein
MTDTRDMQTAHDASTTQEASATQSSAATSGNAATAGQATQDATNAPGAPERSDEPAPLDRLISSIRASVAPGVSAEMRSAGAAACRALLTALEAQVGQPLMPGAPATLATPATPAATLASLLTQLASMPREQILEFLRNRFPAGAPPSGPISRITGPRFHLIQLPPVRPRGNGR